jgi:hypothetical protein
MILQSRWRRHKDNLSYIKLKRAALTYQCAWRGRVARRELRQLKMVLKNLLYCVFLVGSLITAFFVKLTLGCKLSRPQEILKL